MKSRATRVIVTLIALAFLTALAAPWPAQAADIRAQDEIVVAAGQVVDDNLYALGRIVRIDGTVNGDVVALAQDVVVNGTINGDLLGGAQTIVVNGTVEDVRIGGQVILLDRAAALSGDFVAGSYSVETRAGSVVERDVMIGAYQALLAGTVNRSVRAGTSRFELTGSVAGDVDVEVSRVNANEVSPSTYVSTAPAPSVAMPVVLPGLTIANEARIGGRLIYRSYDTVTPPAGTVTGEVVHMAPNTREVRADAQPPQPGPLDIVLDQVRRLIALLVIGVLLAWLAPRWLGALADTVQARPLVSLLAGVAALLLVVFAVVLVLGLGILIALALGLLTLGNLAWLVFFLSLVADAVLIIGYIAFAAFVADVVIGTLIGRTVLQQTRAATASLIAAVAVGVTAWVIVTGVLGQVPVLGGLISFAALLVALGALAQMAWAGLRRRPERIAD